MQLTGTEENHIALRKIIVEFEAKKFSIFVKKVQAAKRDFTAHLESMQNSLFGELTSRSKLQHSCFKLKSTKQQIMVEVFTYLKSLLSSLACVDDIKIRPKQGWLELLFTNNHFDSIQPESTTVKLIKPTLLETQATINLC